ncbi:serine/arginine repetitive matrix protein 1-like [Mustela nigripes]|uniref:serine/arginine repetitive matrix protein 1-like n=1 Tax=Mustela nigripes TaxID=77151 RepID=UPI0028165677|nr:serine/arginine repetitive matrix protein 1-like [Mustela nigripes]
MARVARSKRMTITTKQSYEVRGVLSGHCVPAVKRVWDELKPLGGPVRPARPGLTPPENGPQKGGVRKGPAGGGGTPFRVGGRARAEVGDGARGARREVSGRSEVRAARHRRVPRRCKEPRPSRPRRGSPPPRRRRQKAASVERLRPPPLRVAMATPPWPTTRLLGRSCPPPLRTTFPVRLSKRERARPPPADAHCQRPLTTEKSSVPLREMRRVADCGGPLPALAAALPLRPRPGLTNCRDGRQRPERRWVLPGGRK